MKVDTNGLINFGVRFVKCTSLGRILQARKVFIRASPKTQPKAPCRFLPDRYPEALACAIKKEKLLFRRSYA
jgi:hypothetical protein